MPATRVEPLGPFSAQEGLVITDASTCSPRRA